MSNAVAAFSLAGLLLGGWHHLVHHPHASGASGAALRAEMLEQAFKALTELDASLAEPALLCAKELMPQFEELLTHTGQLQKQQAPDSHDLNIAVDEANQVLSSAEQLCPGPKAAGFRQRVANVRDALTQAQKADQEEAKRKATAQAVNQAVDDGKKVVERGAAAAQSLFWSVAKSGGLSGGGAGTPTKPPPRPCPERHADAGTRDAGTRDGGRADAGTPEGERSGTDGCPDDEDD